MKELFYRVRRIKGMDTTKTIDGEIFGLPIDGIIDAYIGTEDPIEVFRSYDTIIDIFTMINNPIHSADKSETETFNALPDRVKIYRGVYGEYLDDLNMGTSWTLKESTGKFFGRRFKELAENVYLMQGVIDKKDILFYTNQRKEHEIIVDPSKIKNFRWEYV